MFDMSIGSGDIRDQSRKSRNFTFFGPPFFFWGGAPEFLDLHYKIEPDSHHVAKFDGDRWRELGEEWLTKKHHG